MPSPLAHVFAGSLAAYFAQRNHVAGRSVRMLATCWFFSMAPDLDAVVGMAFGKMAEFHNNATHSIAAAVVFCLILLPLTRRVLGDWQPAGAFVLSFVCYATHIGMDWMTFGRGVKLFWPVTDSRYHAPFELFHGVWWSKGPLSHSHIDTLVNEALIIGVCLLAMVAGRYLTGMSAQRK